MALRFPENLIAYHADVENRGHAAVRLTQVEAAFERARTAAAVNDLRVRQTALQWQTILQQADYDFAARRYEEALAGYQNVSRRVLALIEPRVSRLRTPMTWPEGTAIMKALVGATAELISHMVPEQQLSPLVLQNGSTVKVDQLGAAARPVVTAAHRVSEDVISTADRAAAAAEQGRWEEAGRLYREALDGVGNDDPQLHANLLLNLGAVEIQRNQPAVALELLTTAQTEFRALDDQLGMAEALHNSGLAHLRSGNGDEAAKTLDQARSVAGQASMAGLLERPSTPPTRASSPIATTPIPGTAAPSVEPTRASSGDGVRTLNFLGEATAIRRTAHLPTAAITDTVFASPMRSDAAQLAASLGSFDLSLKMRAATKNVAQNDLLLETPAQEMQDSFARSLTLVVGEEPVTLTWSPATRLSGEALLDSVYHKRIESKTVLDLGFRARDETEVITNLPHLYHLVLPIKMGDCYMNLGEHQAAEAEYRRASRYELINLSSEAPDLWRRMAENAVAWGDSLYRAGETQEALPIYGRLMDEQRAASDSYLYSTESLAATGTTVSSWLTAVEAGTEVPELNPAIAHLLHTVRRRWTYIAAGLDFFGNAAAVVSPFSFQYLQEVARYFAQRAITAEQRYIDFYTRFENGEMTRKELENAAELSQLEIDAARHREQAANATFDAADANVDFARIRRQNAQDQLNQFNDVAWELESLAGHIARGNAWTGDDLPNLDYSAGGRYHFDGPKHQVLQQLTKRQTQITNDLQRARMEDNAAEMNAAEDVAEAQRNAAQAQLDAARIETDIARERAEHADNMLDAFNEQKFNPEQWLAMASLMRWLANTALDRAIDVSRLMERGYNFENFDNRKTIRDSYRLAYTGEMLGAELLLSDVDSFTHYHVTRVREKPIPVKWAISLPEQYPGQFTQFGRTGQMEFEVDVARVIEAHPGTYRHQLQAIELEVDGFLPPTGLRGRLTNSGLGRFRGRDGSVNLRVQPAETLILSRFDRRQDSIILTPPQEMRALFEGNSVASGWTLEVPRGSNDVDLNVVFDIRLVLYFECLYDRNLFGQDTQPPIAQLLQRTRALYLRQHFPDAYYQLRETGRAVIDLQAADFPRNQRQPMLRSLALAIITSNGTSLEGSEVKITHPGASAAATVTVSPQMAIPSSDLPMSGEPSALGRYEIELDPDRKDSVADVTLVMDYGFTPA